jgi:predicted transcriptional regulator of viral defense system
MRTTEAISALLEWDRRGRYVFLKQDLAKIINDPSENTRDATIRRLAGKGILTRVAQGVYLFAHSVHISATTLEDIALALRRGEMVYESLESALSQWGRISQVPLDRMTLMTTGRKGEFKTPFGVIEFTHTKRSAADINANTVNRPGHRIPLASEAYALENLRATGRNLTMVDTEG